MSLISISAEGVRPYDVHVGRGLLDEAGGLVMSAAGARRVAVVSDAQVGALYGQRVDDSLRAAGLTPIPITVAEGEAAKSFEGLQSLLGVLLDSGLDRGDAVLALGGGSTGDLAGLAAALYMRGIDVIQAPTTLLAQADSAVGGKTAIDAPQGKNLIGAFWHPRLVLCDLEALDTLDDRQMRSGYAEVLKYGLLGDRAFFEWLEANGAAVLDREPEHLAHAVETSVRAKAAIVAEDPREAGRRALLNLGHTFGHAWEAEGGFGEVLTHGEAVALGCVQAFQLSARLGLCNAEEAHRVEAAVRETGLPVRAPAALRGVSADALLARMAGDKKAEGGRLTLILARGIGRAEVVRDVAPEAVREVLIEGGAA
ncbi:3-dehydroquinate synthase [Brevundimonas sp. 2R-24]|uniref:3-dehydroquinate synthase n=1 Tax=Peiella sedimenti TaxID=3061083 RepID=A0ABT8SLP9_9CAUL|nr:3-dehydroquinate synthase [Caulobacteraceae bacterium XZ-24]